MRSPNNGEIEALVITLIGDGNSRADRIKALTGLVKGLAFEDDAVARLNLYAEALDAMTEVEEFSTLGLVVGGRVVRVKQATGAPQ